MDLERELSALRVEWPATPAFSYARRRRRRPIALAVVLAAVAVAFAVPQSRGAILRFFDVGAVHVRVVDTLPRATERPLGAGLGPVVSLATAEERFPRLRLPAAHGPLHLAPGDVLSIVFESHGSPVVLQEFPSGFYVKKLVGGATKVEPAVVRGAGTALWISGGPHAFAFPPRSPRLAGNVLLWESEDTTFRLEGPKLRKDEAISLAQSLRRG
jgi:hypothetical protein